MIVGPSSVRVLGLDAKEANQAIGVVSVANAKSELRAGRTTTPDEAANDMVSAAWLIFGYRAALFKEGEANGRR